MFPLVLLEQGSFEHSLTALKWGHKIGLQNLLLFSPTQKLQHTYSDVSALKLRYPTKYWENLWIHFEKVCFNDVRSPSLSPISGPKKANVAGLLDCTVWKQNTNKKEAKGARPNTLPNKRKLSALLKINIQQKDIDPKWEIGKYQKVRNAWHEDW